MRRPLRARAPSDPLQLCLDVRQLCGQLLGIDRLPGLRGGHLRTSRPPATTLTAQADTMTAIALRTDKGVRRASHALGAIGHGVGGLTGPFDPASRPGTSTQRAA